MDIDPYDIDRGKIRADACRHVLAWRFDQRPQMICFTSGEVVSLCDLGWEEQVHAFDRWQKAAAQELSDMGLPPSADTSNARRQYVRDIKAGKYKPTVAAALAALGEPAATSW